MRPVLQTFLLLSQAKYGWMSHVYMDVTLILQIALLDSGSCSACPLPQSSYCSAPGSAAAVFAALAACRSAG